MVLFTKVAFRLVYLKTFSVCVTAFRKQCCQKNVFEKTKLKIKKLLQCSTNKIPKTTRKTTNLQSWIPSIFTSIWYLFIWCLILIFYNNFYTHFYINLQIFHDHQHAIRHAYSCPPAGMSECCGDTQTRTRT